MSLLKSIDTFLLTGATDEQDMAIINKYHKVSEHKRKMPAAYKSNEETLAAIREIRGMQNGDIPKQSMCVADFVREMEE